MNKTKAVFIVLSSTAPIPPPAGLTPGSPSSLGWDHHLPLSSFPQVPSKLRELGWDSCWALAGQIRKGSKPRTINHGLKSPRKTMLTLALTPIDPEDLRTIAQILWRALWWLYNNRRVWGVSDVGANSTIESLIHSELGREHQLGRKGVGPYWRSPDEGFKTNPNGLDFSISFCPLQRNGWWHQKRFKNPDPELSQWTWGKEFES